MNCLSRGMQSANPSKTGLRFAWLGGTALLLGMASVVAQGKATPMQQKDATGKAQFYQEDALQKAKTLSPGPQADLATRYMAKAQAEAGDIAGALETVKEIQNPVWRSDTIGDVVQVQAQSGDITGALRLAESMNKDTYQANAIGEIAARQMLAGSDVDAEKTLSLLGQGLPRIEGDLAVAQVLIGDSVKDNGDE